MTVILTLLSSLVALGFAFAAGVVYGTRLIMGDGPLRAAAEFNWTRQKLDQLFRTAKEEAGRRARLR